MPDPPEVGLFTRFVLENPWPLAIALAAAAAAFAWIGVRDGRRKPLTFAGAIAVAALLVLAIGLIVTTPAEHGKRVTRELVSAAVAADVRSALALFAPDAALTVGSPTNPGFDIAVIERQLTLLQDRYRIRDNRITMLRGYTQDRDTAVVHLACWTDVEGGYGGSTPSQWVLRIARQPDESWMITRITAVSIAGRTPSDRLW